MDNDMDEAGIVFLRFSAQMKRWNETFFLPMRKAVASITYGVKQTAMPGSLFLPVSAAERQELLQG